MPCQTCKDDTRNDCTEDWAMPVAEYDSIKAAVCLLEEMQANAKAETLYEWFNAEATFIEQTISDLNYWLDELKPDLAYEL